MFGPQAIGLFSPFAVVPPFVVVDTKRDRVCSDPMAQIFLKTELKSMTSTATPCLEEMSTLVSYPPSREVFYKFLESTYCEENLEFWLAVERLKDYEYFSNEDSLFSDGDQAGIDGNNGSKSTYKVHNIALDILNRFLADTAPKPINVDYTLRERLLSTFESEDSESMISAFADAQGVILALLFHDAYPKFRDSELFREFVDGLLSQTPIIRPMEKETKKVSKQDWIPDKEASQCMVCSISFTLINRRVSAWR